MNWDRIEGQWKQRRGKATHHWGKVMNDELAAIAGRYEELVGSLQEEYGLAREKTRDQVEEFKKTIGLLKKSNRELINLQKSLRKKEQSAKKAPRTVSRLAKGARSGPAKRQGRKSS